MSNLAQRVWVVEGEQQKLWWLLVWENPDERTNNGSKVKAPPAVTTYGATPPQMKTSLR